MAPKKSTNASINRIRLFAKTIFTPLEKYLSSPLEAIRLLFLTGFRPVTSLQNSQIFVKFRFISRPIHLISKFLTGSRPAVHNPVFHHHRIFVYLFNADQFQILIKISAENSKAVAEYFRLDGEPNLIDQFLLQKLRVEICPSSQNR